MNALTEYFERKKLEKELLIEQENTPPPYFTGMCNNFAGNYSIWLSWEPTNELRWNGVILEQLWTWQDQKEWRAVPQKELDISFGSTDINFNTTCSG